jgi:hypothetical protein
MRTTLAIWSVIFLTFSCAAYIGAQAYDIWRHGFIECYQTTTFYGDEFLCVARPNHVITL